MLCDIAALSHITKSQAVTDFIFAFPPVRYFISHTITETSAVSANIFAIIFVFFTSFDRCLGRDAILIRSFIAAASFSALYTVLCKHDI